MVTQTRTIQIRVTDDAARAYESAAPEEQRRFDALLSLKLSDLGRRKRSLEEIMDEISDKARERGLTPEILDSILNER